MDSTLKIDVPPVLTQGYRIGAKVNDKLFVNVGSGSRYEANILMENGVDTHPLENLMYHL